MKNYIFLTIEGHTYQPNAESIDPDIENLQVIGFSNGVNSRQAFQKLVNENEYLLETKFEELFSYELDEDYEANKAYHYLADAR